MKLSVVIPLTKDDQEKAHWSSLVHLLDDRLGNIIGDFEIILTSPYVYDVSGFNHVKWVKSFQGRALQMNKGVKDSTGEYLWFLHCDSELEHETLLNLRKLFNFERVLYFHNLHFFDGPLKMSINELGVWIRSHLFKMPFGDQGLFIRKELFNELGGFPEEAPYGEDHLFVWKAMQNKITVKYAGAKIGTSARKYIGKGWGQTTLNHLFLTYKQAAPEFIKLIKSKF